MNAQAITIDQTSSSVDVSSTFIKNLLLATLVAGTLDAAAGIAVYDFALGQMGIVQILQWIASGAFGKQAFEMGILGAFYGLVFHYIVAFFASLAVFAVKSRITAIKEYPIITGLAYGGWVWIFMNFVVLPNSSTVLAPFSAGVALTGYIWHMLFVGLPITLYASKE